MNNVFGTRLKQRRLSKGISRPMLTTMTGVATNTIHGIENGKNMPMLYNAMLLAEALDVSLDWMVGRTDNEQAHKK